MAKKPPNQEFLSEIAGKLREGLERKKELAKAEGQRYTRSRAASDLCVSRASLQFYLAGKHMPSGDVLSRAMELWGIELTYRGHKLTSVDLENGIGNRQMTPAPFQLDLWDSIKKLDTSSLSVQLKKKAQASVTLEVEIAFGHRVG